MRSEGTPRVKLPPPGDPPPRPRASTAAELEHELFGDGSARSASLSLTVSTEIAAAIAGRVVRYRRAALGVAAGAALVALAGFAAHRMVGPASPEAVAAAHVEAADRLLREGRVTGKDGALDHLLAARRLRPGDAETARRLDRVADLLERLAAGALDRGDLPVAAIHLASARAAAPDRPSLGAKQAELDRRARLASSRTSGAPR